jgi:hypothetical protein
MVCNTKSCPKSMVNVRIRNLPNILIDSLLTVSKPIITNNLLIIYSIVPPDRTYVISTAQSESYHLVVVLSMMLLVFAGPVY